MLMAHVRRHLVPDRRRARPQWLPSTAHVMPTYWITQITRAPISTPVGRRPAAGGPRDLGRGGARHRGPRLPTRRPARGADAIADRSDACAALRLRVDDDARAAAGLGGRAVPCSRRARAGVSGRRPRGGGWSSGRSGWCSSPTPFVYVVHATSSCRCEPRAGGLRAFCVGYVLSVPLLMAPGVTDRRPLGCSSLCVRPGSGLLPSPVARPDCNVYVYVAVVAYAARHAARRRVSRRSSLLLATGAGAAGAVLAEHALRSTCRSPSASAAVLGFVSAAPAQRRRSPPRHEELKSTGRRAGAGPVRPGPARPARPQPDRDHRQGRARRAG